MQFPILTAFTFSSFEESQVPIPWDFRYIWHYYAYTILPQMKRSHVFCRSCHKQQAVRNGFHFVFSEVGENNTTGHYTLLLSTAHRNIWGVWLIWLPRPTHLRDRLPERSPARAIACPSDCLPEWPLAHMLACICAQRSKSLRLRRAFPSLTSQGWILPITRNVELWILDPSFRFDKVSDRSWVLSWKSARMVYKKV